MKKIGIFYNPPVYEGNQYWLASSDVLLQVDAVEKALQQLGCCTIRIPFSKSVQDTIMGLQDSGVDGVFNLCETVNENALLAGHPAALLELLNISFSGSPSVGITISTDKILTKQVMQASGIGTANYALCDDPDNFVVDHLKFPVILKPRFEDASIGIGQDSIFTDVTKLKEVLKNHGNSRELFVEEYIEGREFNVSVFGYPRPQVLPIAETDFSTLPKNLYRILTYAAKWDEASVEYSSTIRVFPTHLEKQLAEEIKTVAMKSFRACMLRDYARVDIRVDAQGRIYVLELNANPCITTGMGLPAAVEESGMNYVEMISKLLDFIMQRKK